MKRIAFLAGLAAGIALIACGPGADLLKNAFADGGSSSMVYSTRCDKPNGDTTYYAELIVPDLDPTMAPHVTAWICPESNPFPHGATCWKLAGYTIGAAPGKIVIEGCDTADGHAPSTNTNKLYVRVN